MNCSIDVSSEAAAVNRAQSEWEALLRSPRGDRIASEIKQAINTPQHTPREGLKRSNAAHVRSLTSQKQKETKPTWGKNTSKKQPNRLKWKEIRNEIPKHLLHDNVKLRKRTPEEAMETPRSILLEPEPQQPSYTPYSAGTGRISDLNDAEKAKLSQLIQQLVKVESEKESIQQQLETDRQQYTMRLERLKTQNKEIIDETTELRTKFSHSLEMLRTYQERLVTVQKQYDQQQALRSDAERLNHELRDKLNASERQVKKLQSDIDTNAAMHKREFNSQLKIMERQVEDAHEKLRLEKQKRLQEQNIYTLKLAQYEKAEKERARKQLNEMKAAAERIKVSPAAVEAAEKIPKQMQDILEQWTTRLQNALEQSYSKKSVSAVEEKEPAVPDISIDIKPKPQAATPPLSRSSRRNPGATISPGETKYTSPYAQKLPRKKSPSPKRTRSTKQTEALLSSLNSSYDPVADSEYHEMSLFELVDDLEKNSSRQSDSDIVRKLNPCTSYDMDDDIDTTSLGPLSATDLTIQEAVERDLRDFLR